MDILLLFTVQELSGRDFPGSPVVKTLSFYCGGLSLIPGWGTKIPHVLWCSHKRKKKRCVFFFLKSHQAYPEIQGSLSSVPAQSPSWLFPTFKLISLVRWVGSKLSAVITTSWKIWKEEFPLSGKRILLGSVLSQQRFGVTDIKALGVSQLSGLGQTVL